MRARVRRVLARALVRGLLAALALAGAGTPARAQENATTAASPVLPPGHWARAALARLDALGLLGSGFDPGAGSVTRAEAAYRLARAGDGAAARGDARIARLVAAYRARFVEEFPDDSARGGTIRRLPGSVSGGYGAYGGQPLTGYDRDALHVLPALEARRRSMYGTADVALALGSRAALVASGRAEDEEPGLEAGYALVTVGAARLWLGRRPLGFGAAPGGSAVLTAGPSFDGAGVFTGPLRPGGALRALGPVRLEAFGSRIPLAGALADPWFLAARIWTQPHPRLWLAGTRAVAFGGHGNTPLTLAELPGILVGAPGGAHGETENQVASLEARWRVPAGAWPVVAYAEWAIDDVGFEFVRQPGLIEGVELAALPALPALSLGLEHTHFPQHCCSYPPWYRHSALPWIDRRAPLGHPLGGAGSQWLLHSRADLLDARLRLDGRLLRRDRLPDNLYAPMRLGVSTGAQLALEWTPAGALGVYASASLEQGRGWRQEETSAGMRVRF